MKKFNLFALAFAGVLASCSSNDIAMDEKINQEVIDEVETPTPILLNAGGVINAETSTRGAITPSNWVGTKVGVFLIPRAGLTIGDNLPVPQDWTDPGVYGAEEYQFTWGNKTILKNMEATVQEDGSLQFTSLQFYPQSSDRVKYTFVGVHPTNNVVQMKNSVASSLASTYPNRMEISYDIKGYNDIMCGMAQEIYDSAYSAAFAKASNVTKDGVATGKTGDQLRPKIKFKHLLTQLNFMFKNADNNNASEEVYIDSIVVKDQYSGMTIRIDMVPNTDYETANQDTLDYTWFHTGTRDKAISVRDTTVNDSLLLENVITVTEAEQLWADAHPDNTSNDAQTAGGKELRKQMMKPYAVPLKDEAFKKIGGSLMLLSQNVTAEELKAFEFEVYTRTYDNTTTEKTIGPNIVKQAFKGDGNVIKARGIAKAPGGDSAIFEPGKAYNIKIRLGSNTELKVDAELTDWTNGGDVEVDAE